jgi:alanine-glyoxylate transaminase / (R)-3-amino-2-methylpropionate-pyruvate transaminase
LDLRERKREKEKERRKNPKRKKNTRKKSHLFLFLPSFLLLLLHPPTQPPGRAVLAAVDEDQCQQTSLRIGERLVKGLRKIQARQCNSVIGDVRGSGLMLGIDLVSDSKRKTPNAAAAAAVSESLKSRGILIGKGGLRGNVLRVKPPMCWSEGDADFFLEALEESLREL